MGQLDNTIVVFTTDNGAEAISFPDGGVTPFKGQKGEAYEGVIGSPAPFGGRNHQAWYSLYPDVCFSRMAAEVRGNRRRTAQNWVD